MNRFIVAAIVTLAIPTIADAQCASGACGVGIGRAYRVERSYSSAAFNYASPQVGYGLTAPIFRLEAPGPAYAAPAYAAPVYAAPVYAAPARESYYEEKSRTTTRRRGLFGRRGGW